MSNKLFYLICLALVLAIGGFARAELLINEGFEAGAESWDSWGSGSGSGSGGLLWSDNYHVTVMEDGTAHSGDKYVEVGFEIPAANTEWWGWGYAIIWQNLPVIAGNEYHASAWVRDGNADGAESQIEGGTQIVFEWFADADNRLDVNGDGETNNDDKNFYTFDLTGEWTQISASEIAPPGATVSRVLFGTGQMNVNVDVDDTSVTEMVPPVTIPVPDAGFDDHVLSEGTWSYVGDGPWPDYEHSDYTGPWQSAGGDSWIDYGYYAADGDLPALSGNNKLYGYEEIEDSVYQILDETYVEGVTYTLGVSVGAPWEGYDDSWSLYFTGEDYTDELASISGNGPIGEWGQASLDYTATTADAGKKIGIKLRGDQYVNFDDVSLSYVEEPQEIVETIFLVDDFESYADDAELAAAGWTIVDTPEAIEASTWTITNPGSRGNPATLDGSASTGKFLISDSDQQTETNPVDSGASHDITTPSFSTLGFETVWLHVDVSAQLNNNGSAIFDVEVSTDSGETWTNVFSRVAPGRESAKGGTTRLPDNTNTDGYFGRLDVDISAVAANQENVQVRFRHFEPTWDWWIAIDNVLIDDVPAPQGGSVTVFSEDFSNGLGQMNAVSGQGNTGTETWHTSDKGGRYVPGAVGEKGVNRLGPHPNEHPEFAILDSDANPDPAEDEWLMTPVLDLSALSQVFLHYDSETIMSSGVSNQEVLVSLDGGTTFEATPIFAYTGGGLFDNGEEPVFAERIFDVSGIADGQNQVVFAFRYTGGGDNWWWAIDNVKVSGEWRLVSVENPSFELPGTEKIKGWNGEGVAGTPAVDIPGWSSDTIVADSGVETGFGPTDGEWTAFLMSGDPSAWQLTDHTIGEGNVLELRVDARITWAATAMQMTLYYDDNGVRIPASTEEVTLTNDMQEYTLSLIAADVPDAVGKQIGIEFSNTSTGDTWIGLDNVRLILVAE